MSSQLLNVGAFSLLSGLSIDALRHYDEIGLLPPTEVDPVTSYRRYHLDQVSTARRIRALRAVDLPIDDVRDLVDANEEETSDALRVHRGRLDDRRRALAEVIETLDDYIENGVRMQQSTPSCRVAEVNLGVDDVEAARRFYEATFGLEFTEDRHDDGFVHLLAAFGAWPSDEFFLLNIHDGADDPYRAGRANFGFLVDDLDAVHKRALAAGGAEIDAPHYVPAARAYVTRFPAADIAEAKRHYPAAVHPALDLGVIVLYQRCTHLGCRTPWCETSHWYECPCHGAKFDQVGEKRAGPARRGLDLMPASVRQGQLLVDTRAIVKGMPIGTNTTHQEPEGPFCV